MPSRLIREGLMDSERVCKLPIEARWLFVTVCLVADDVGLFDAAPYALMRKAELQRDLGPQLLSALHEVDLIRLYDVGGKRYGFIPRFGQRLQMRRIKHPLPPLELVSGDEDAASKIKDLTSRFPKPTEIPRNLPLEAEAEAEEEIEKTSLSRGSARPEPEHPELALDGEKATAGVPSCPHSAILALWAELLPSMPQHIPAAWKGQRVENLKTRWREVVTDKPGRSKEEAHAYGLRYFRRLFGHIGKSQFLTGRGSSKDGRPFKAELEWVVKFANWAKIIEGKYHEEKV